MKKGKSLFEWLASPPSKDPTDSVSVGFIRNAIKLMGLMMVYLTARLIYHGVSLFYNAGFFDWAVDLAKSLAKYKDAESMMIPAVGLVLTAGYLLYIFKKRQQFYYGLLETAFALGSCHKVGIEVREAALKNSDTSSFLLVTGTAALYLLVRGLSNMDDGWRKPFYLSIQLHNAFFIKGSDLFSK